MALKISPSTSEERKQLFVEILMNKTNKINKISNDSVVNGISYGIAKVAGKAEKDIVQAISKIYPDNAYGSQLDLVAAEAGVSSRFSASQSSTYVKVVADPGTQYLAGTHVFTSTDGIQFDIENNTTIGVHGFDYIKVRSIDSGVKTNTNPGLINKITPVPSGHKFCVNEYKANGGRDLEDDDSFRKRIKEGPNVLAKGTVAMLEQVFMKINSNVLQCRYQGVNSSGQIRIAIITQNGIDLNASELNDLLVKGEQYFSLAELRPFGKKSYGIELINISWQEFYISFRCELLQSAITDNVRIDIQNRISKYIDHRYFNSGVDKIEWDNLLEIVKNTTGMKYVPDEWFYPGVDIPTDPNKIPRLAGFIMMDLKGNVLNNIIGSFNPVYYPQASDFSYQQTVLNSL